MAAEMLLTYSVSRNICLNNNALPAYNKITTMREVRSLFVFLQATILTFLSPVRKLTIQNFFRDHQGRRCHKNKKILPGDPSTTDRSIILLTNNWKCNPWCSTNAAACNFALFHVQTLFFRGANKLL